MSPTAFAHLVQERGIPAQAFAAGYMTFFIYSAIIGIAALVFAIAVMRRSPPASDAAKSNEPAPA
jgi:PAT family beta-lactamase induction signal transducer AmpG